MIKKVQKRQWLGGWVAGCLAVLLVSFPALAQEKKSIAVLDFESPVEKQYFDMGKSASDYLTAQLAEIGSYRVIERSKLEKILKEHELGMLGVVDPDKVKQMGKFLSADYILMGNITFLGDSFSINGRMVDVETGEIVGAKSSVFKDPTQLRVAVKNLARALSDLAKPKSGGQSGQSSAELFMGVSSRDFYDSAEALIREIAAIEVYVVGSITEVNTLDRKVKVASSMKTGAREGLRLKVQKLGFSGPEDVGSIFITQVGTGFLDASYLEGDQVKFSIGDQVTSKKYRFKVAVGPIVDEVEDNQDLTKKYHEAVAENLAGSEFLDSADEDDVQKDLSQLRPGNRKAILAKLFKSGVDLVVEGRFHGTPGARRTDFNLWNAYDGKIVKKISFETKL
ncbi:MAG: CsgG/HfaB family protein [bacterium]|nr:CsgG/HfaB family protein [bacterium]